MCGGNDTSRLKLKNMILRRVTLLPLLVGIVSACDSHLLRTLPDLVVLHAPYTPFGDEPSRPLNASQATIDLLAAQARAFGVNTVWTPGSMGQFEALSMAERKTLLAAWISAGKKSNIYTIAHVGTPVQSDAIELARYAAELGADAIASVPGYYETYSSADTVAEFIQPIAAAAPNLPFFYYHIPAATRSNINAVDLLRTTSDATSRLHVPTLCGIKYVSTNLTDWFFSVNGFNHSHALLFAPEPKMASFALGRGRGVVLAEDFYAPTFLRMYNAWLNGDTAAASGEQAWKFHADQVLRRFGGTAAKRLLYEEFSLTGGKVDMGPARLPGAPFDESRRAALMNALDGVDFWNKTSPASDF
eukprot:g3638.t1